LTFEHVPPRAAFNNEQTRVYGLEDWLKRDDRGEMGGGRLERRGAGDYTLCADCNNKTGSWYGTELRRAAKSAVRVLRGLPLEEIDQKPEPTWARVTFREGAFVLDRDAVGLAHRFQLYLALYAGPLARSTGVVQRIDVATGRGNTLVEVAFPPYAYVMAIDSADREVINTSNITGFVDVGYSQTADLEMDLLIGFGHTPYPADYRTRAMVEHDTHR
jgi:hypothetical protein